MSISSEQKVPLTKHNDQQLVDKGKKVFLIFLVFGVSALLPWNAFITPMDYWNTYYSFDSLFTYYMSFAYNAPALIMLAVMVQWGHKWNLHVRMFTFFILSTVVLVLTPFIHLMFGITDDDEGTRGAQIGCELVTLFVILLTGVSNGIFFPTVISIGTQLDEVMGQAAMEGNGVAGLVTIIIRVITKLCVDDVQTSSLIYFLTGAVIVFISMFLYIALFRIEYSRGVMRTELRKTQRGAHYQDLDEAAQSSAAGDIDLVNAVPTEPPMRKRHVFRLVLMPGVGVMLIFLVTLSLFPGVTAYMDQDCDMDDDWWDIVKNAIFMVFDWVGRSLPKYELFARPSVKTMTLVSALRLLFYPIFILATEDIVNSTFYTCFMLFVFALSNGYVSSLLMMKGPFLVDSDADKATAGTLMTFMLNVGLTVGSFGGIGLGFAIEDRE
eukprot:gnl/Chilomastix_cuspidata/770.p2 GENE.gnl/Chilomastix_cuspidata/770~~gnl/Chilomastix_cuspidata/770.p2  ORF type:complete len:450 (-),score=173.48 gnl/Chilomastix_cuspidata/770:2522-3835(-)